MGNGVQETVDYIKNSFAHHLKYTLATTRRIASKHDLYLALAMAVRDRLIDRWNETRQARVEAKVKRAYYLSLEFLIGRSIDNNVINLGVDDGVRKAMQELNLNYEELREEEAEAGLGNGGLGRLAACFLDSLATLQYPAIGYGLRYDYGIFKQRIQHGYQVEEPDDWMRHGNPWELPRPNYKVRVQFGGRVTTSQDKGRVVHKWESEEHIVGLPYDLPIVGYGGACVNILRLWSARAEHGFSFDEFNSGDYMKAVDDEIVAENLTKVLYPNDKFYSGKELRFKQQYFFVACSLSDILRRVKADNQTIDSLPEKAAIQMNDTHPAMCVAELMRLLVDVEGLEWNKAWDLTVKTLGYTNHTLMPEALEKWPVEMFQRFLPRHLQIIYEINHHFLEAIRKAFPNDEDRVRRMSLIEEGDKKQVRMAYMAIVGSHSVNGVAALHTELLKQTLLHDFFELYPSRFNNKTNGITPRRWLVKSNPSLSKLITEAIGDGWIMDLSKLKLLTPLANDASFREKFAAIKRQNKLSLCEHMKNEWGFVADPDSMFDSQVKRLHEYKRQLLNALHIIVLYNRIRQNPNVDIVPRTFIFSAKAAPGYAVAKLVIKFINSLGDVINNDPVVRGRLKIFFLPNYSVSLAERIIPATELSEQISLAGFEASGTGNMKFMLNGSMTIGTLDGANVEMQEEVGAENFFIFGLTAQQAVDLRPKYKPRAYYEKNHETRMALDLIASNHFSQKEIGIFKPLLQILLDIDTYMHLADLPSYVEAQGKVDALYRDKNAWNTKAILNTACSGKFSSDRTIHDYAREIWGIQPHPISPNKRFDTVVMAAVGR